MNIPVELLAVVLTGALLAIGYLFNQMIDTRQRLATCEADSAGHEKKIESMSSSSLDIEKTVAKMTGVMEIVNGRLERIERLLDELNRKQ